MLCCHVLHHFNHAKLSSIQTELLLFMFLWSLILCSPHQDLVSALKSELGGLFESLIVALMTPSTLYDATQLHKALKVMKVSSEAPLNQH